MKLEKVVLKTGKTIEVLPDEVNGLRNAGLLKESKVPNKTKEEKKVGTTKEEKGIGQTKAVIRRSKNWYPGPGETEEPPPRPANIDSNSFKTAKK